MAITLTQQETIEIKQVAARILDETRSDSALQMLAATVLTAALALYIAEKDSGGSIKTFGDALWNAFSTVCAVGESGCPPTTPLGRLISSMLMLVGNPLYDQTKHKIGSLLSDLTGSGQTPERKTFEAEVLARLDQILERLEAKEPVNLKPKRE